jgi:hypothetical protein
MAQTVTDGRVWTTLSLQGRPGDASAWRWASDVTTRFRDGIDALDTLTARLMALYDLSAGTSIGGGYVLANAYPAGLSVTTEHRIFQQFQWQGRAGPATLAARTRLEERSVEGNSAWAVRVRQQVRYTHPLGASRVSVVGWEEVFVHANATSRYARGFEQNRAFAGIGLALPAGPRLEAGYLNQFILGRGGPDRMNHVLALTVSAAF